MPHEAFVMARCMRARVCTPSAGVRCVSADGTCTGMALVVVTARRHHRHVTAGCIPIFRAPGTEVIIIFDSDEEGEKEEEEDDDELEEEQEEEEREE